MPDKKDVKKSNEKEQQRIPSVYSDITNTTNREIGNMDRTMLQGMATKKPAPQDHRRSEASSSKNPDKTKTATQATGSSKKPDSKDRSHSDVRQSDVPKHHHTSTHRDHNPSTEKHHSTNTYKPSIKEPSSYQSTNYDRRDDEKRVKDSSSQKSSSAQASGSSKRVPLDWTQQHIGMERTSPGAAMGSARFPSKAFDWTQQYPGIQRPSAGIAGGSGRFLPLGLDLSKIRANMVPSSGRLPRASLILLPSHLDRSRHRTEGTAYDRHPTAPLPEPTRRTPANLQSTSGSMKSKPPSFAKSTLRTTKDQEMAERQSRIASMRPHEREEQNKWAQDQLRQRGSCPVNLNWLDVEGGYMCVEGQHAVTHGDIKEGRNGLRFNACVPSLTNYYFGPYYKDKNFGSHGIWRYGGSLPKHRHAPEAYVEIVADNGDHMGRLKVVNGMVDTLDAKVPLDEYEKIQKYQERLFCQHPSAVKVHKFLAKFKHFQDAYNGTLPRIEKGICFDAPPEHLFIQPGDPIPNGWV